MEIIVSTFIFGLILIYPLWRIFSRAGRAPALSLLFFIPFFGAFIVLAILAFSRWPAREGAGRS